MLLRTNDKPARYCYTVLRRAHRGARRKNNDTVRPPRVENTILRTTRSVYRTYAHTHTHIYNTLLLLFLLLFYNDNITTATGTLGAKIQGRRRRRRRRSVPHRSRRLRDDSVFSSGACCGRSVGRSVVSRKVRRRTDRRICPHALARARDTITASRFRHAILLLLLLLLLYSYKHLFVYTSSGPGGTSTNAKPISEQNNSSPNAYYTIIQNRINWSRWSQNREVLKHVDCFITVFDFTASDQWRRLTNCRRGGRRHTITIVTRISSP